MRARGKATLTEAPGETARRAAACERAVQRECVPRCSRAGASRTECFHCGARACARTRQDWPPGLRAAVLRSLRGARGAADMSAAQLGRRISAAVREYRRTAERR